MLPAIGTVLPAIGTVLPAVGTVLPAVGTVLPAIGTELSAVMRVCRVGRLLEGEVGSRRRDFRPFEPPYLSCVTALYPAEGVIPAPEDWPDLMPSA